MARTISNCINRCKSDFECSFNKKCCVNICGSTSCAESGPIAHGSDLRDYRNDRKSTVLSHSSCSFHVPQGDTATSVMYFCCLVKVYTSEYSTGQQHKTNKNWQRIALVFGKTRTRAKVCLITNEHRKRKALLCRSESFGHCCVLKCHV